MVQAIRSLAFAVIAIEGEWARAALEKASAEIKLIW